MAISIILLLGGAAVIPITVSLPEFAAAAPPLSVTLEARLETATGDARESVVSKQVRLVGRRVSTTIGLPDGAWKVSAAAAGHWSPAATVLVPGSEDGVAFRLFPTGAVSQRIEGLGSAGAVVQIAFRGSPEAAEPARVPEGAKSCPVQAQHLACELPAGLLDLRLEAEGFVPEYYWAMNVQPRKEHTLAPVRLSKGSSVAGFVRSEDNRPAKDALVEIITLSGEEIRPSKPVKPRSQAHGGRGLKAITNGRGFFQIRGAPGGEFQLAARQGSLLALAAARLDADRETRLPDFMVLEQPYDLSVRVEPSVAPGGERWTLKVVRFEPYRSQVHQSLASTDGAVEVRGISRGRYSLELWKGGERWFGESVAVDGTPAPVIIRLPMVAVRGTLRLGGHALQGELTFGGSNGPTSIVMRSDEEGEFSGTLPRAGDWVVSILAQEPPVRRKLSRVSVAAEYSSDARLSIDLPDTQLRGRVVDEAGAAIRGLVTVVAHGADDRPDTFPVDPGESFELRGLAEGEFSLEAEGEGEERPKSEVQRITLARGDRAEVTLVVKDSRTLRGRLQSADGRPIAGGTLLAFETEGLGSPFYQTDAGGSFKVPVRAGVRELTVLYWADAYPMRLARIAVSSEPALLVLGPLGGSLIVDFGRELNLADYTAAASPVLQSGDAHISVASVFGLALRRRAYEVAPQSPIVTALELPQMSPGTYALCVQPRAGVFLGSAPPGPCDHGTLAAGGSLQLALRPESWPTSKN